MAGARLAAAVVVGVFLVVATACGAIPRAQSGTTPPPSMNVTGTIDRAATAACPTDEPCDPQIVAYRLVFSRPGQPDVTVRPGPDGSFAVHLDPGSYTIVPQPPLARGRLDPSSVRIPESGTIELHLRITG